MNIKPILERMIQDKASDLHIKAGTPPTIRVDGSLIALEHEGRPSSKEIDEIVAQILTPKQQKEFEDSHEIDFAFSIPGLCRFRANFYKQRGTVAMAFRQVPFGVPKMNTRMSLMMKCDMCYDRTSVGLKPMCASVCPSQALTYTTREEMARRRPGAKPVNTFRFGLQTIRTKVNVMVPQQATHEVLDVTSAMYEPSIGHEVLDDVFAGVGVV